MTFAAQHRADPVVGRRKDLALIANGARRPAVA